MEEIKRLLKEHALGMEHEKEESSVIDRCKSRFELWLLLRYYSAIDSEYGTMDSMRKIAVIEKLLPDSEFLK